MINYTDKTADAQPASVQDRSRIEGVDMEHLRIICQAYYIVRTATKGTIWIYVFGILGEDTFDCLVLDAGDKDQLIPRAMRPETLINQVEPSQVPELLRRTVEDRYKIVKF